MSGQHSEAEKKKQPRKTVEGSEIAAGRSPDVNRSTSFIKPAQKIVALKVVPNFVS